MKLFLAFSIFIFTYITNITCYSSFKSDNLLPMLLKLKNNREYNNDLIRNNHFKNNFGFNDNNDDMYGSNDDDVDNDGDASNESDEELSELNYLSQFKKSLGQSSEDYNSLKDTLFGFDELSEIQTDPRDQESELHSSLVNGYQFVSGGAGEGKQHLTPNGYIPNKEEVKSDIDLPAYCDPPNPCPIGYEGDDCDIRPYGQFTAEFSKQFQEKQNCMCDQDHNDCKKQTKYFNDLNNQKIKDFIAKENSASIVAKKSPRARRSIKVEANKKINEKPLRFHVAKKSPQV